ncbi:DUF6207 family protein [[Kitasatospora] papulosa]
MREIGEQHISEPGLVVLDTTATNEDTLRLTMAQMEEHWATSGPAPARWVSGRPDVTPHWRMRSRIATRPPTKAE